jgi:hypothetical protein
MAINRYYKPVEQVIMDDWFEPDLNMVGMALQSAQTQHDTVKTNIDKLKETTVKHLEADTPHVEEELHKLFSSIDELSAGASGDGDLRTVKYDIDKLTRDTARRFRREGDFGSAEMNYGMYNEWAKEEKEKLKQGKINQEQYNAMNNALLQQYAAQDGIGQYTDDKGYQDIKLQQIALYSDIGDLIEQHGTGYKDDFWQGTDFTMPDGTKVNAADWKKRGYRWIKDKNGYRVVKEQDVFNDLIGAVLNDDTYRNYLTQANQIGISPYGVDDIYKKDENGQYMVDEEGRYVYNKQHPVISEALRGASKWGFEHITHDQEMKFDPMDRETHASNLRIKEEQLKGQLMVFNSSSVDKSINPTEITEHVKTLTASVSTKKQLVEKLQQEVANATGDRKTILQQQLNGQLDELKTLENQQRNSQRTLDELATVGGWNWQKEFVKYADDIAEQKVKDWLFEQGIENITSLPAKEQERILAESKRLRTETRGTVMANMQLSGFKDLMTTDEGTSAVKDGSGYGLSFNVHGDLMRQYRTRLNTAHNKGSEIGLHTNDSVILSSKDTPLGRRMDMITEALAKGSLSFIDEQGRSIGQNDINDAIASGKVHIAPLTRVVDGKPGFEISITKDGKKQVYKGNINGLENSSWVQDMELDFRMAAESPNISVTKSNNLIRTANLLAGNRLRATTYNPTTGQFDRTLGVGTLSDQLEQQNLEVINEGSTSGDVYLPKGFTMKLTAVGDGTYLPKLYRPDGVAVPRKDTPWDKTRGGLSREDIITAVGNSKEFQAQRNPPAYNPRQTPATLKTQPTN